MRPPGTGRTIGGGGEPSWGKLGALFHRRRDLLLILALIAVTVLSYLPLFRAGFIRYDDPMYVGPNTFMGQGLKWSVIKHIFTSLHYDQYYPVTLLSHAFDCQLFGQDATLHHVMSLAFHALNVILVFLVLRRMTRRTWRSVFVAALFAVHPLHVEAVAWIAERKELLCTLFALLAIWAYISYVESRSVRRYFWVLFWFALSLLSKPMSVTLPLLLLLLDYWPLGRWTLGGSALAEDSGRQGDSKGRRQNQAAAALRWFRRTAWPLILEKIPLFAMSAAMALITLVANLQGGSVTGLSHFSLIDRAGDAFYAYGQYLVKTFFPVGLAVFYPLHRGGVPAVEVGACELLFLLITALCILRAKRQPFLIVGWLWFVIALAPVIGFLRVGSAQAYADRYTYFSLLGLFAAVTFWIAQMVESSTRAKKISAFVALGLLASLSFLSYRQAGYWRNTVTLFRHDLEVAPRDNYLALAVLGGEYLSEGNLEAGKAYLKRSIQIMPRYSESWARLGKALARQGEFPQAEACLRQAFRFGGLRNPETNYFMGWVLGNEGKAKESLRYLENAVRLRPDYPAAEVELARQLIVLHQEGRARGVLLGVLRRHPGSRRARAMLDAMNRGVRGGE